MTIRLSHHFPLTGPQLSIWMAQELNPDVPLFNLAGYVRISGSIDTGVFRQAVHLVVRDQDALQLRIIEPTESDGLPRQMFYQGREVPLTIRDFSRRDFPEQSIERWIHARFEEKFDLYGKPLFRFDLLKASENLWYLLLQYHHLVIDGYSYGIVLRSLADKYSRLVAGESPAHSGFSYMDFIKTDRDYRTSERFKKDAVFWRSQFTKRPDSLLFRQQGDAGGYGRSACARTTISHQLFTDISCVADRFGATFNQVILGALYTYFATIYRHDDFAIGIAMHNRSGERFKHTAGLFVVALPLRIDFGKNLTFPHLLVKIQQRAKGLYRHHRYPITELHGQLHVTGTARSPLFEINFSQFNFDFSRDQTLHVDFAGSTSISELLQNTYSQTPLDIRLHEISAEGDVYVEFIYNQAYFSGGDISLLIERFLLLLKAIVLSPDRKLAQLVSWETQEQEILKEGNTTISEEQQLDDIEHMDPRNTLEYNTELTLRRVELLTQAEKSQLQAWGQGPQTETPQQTVVSLFEFQVKVRPEATALVFGGRQLSYGELNRKANRVAHSLIANDVGPDVLVGLSCERSLDMIVGLLGILKAGGAYVPIDPRYPEARIRYLLEDSGIRRLMTQTPLLGTLPQIEGMERRCLDTLETDRWPDNETNPPLSAEMANLAYVIYTSGSTGQPKGVLVEHRGLANLVVAQAESFRIAPQAKVLQFASSSFDASIWEVAMALFTGATLVCLQDQEFVSDAKFVDWLSREEISTALLPPSILAVLPDHPLKQLRTLIVGGEACTMEVVDRWAIGRTLINAYGPTESTVCATLAFCRPGEGSPVIGRPVANTEVYVLDTYHQPVPVGIPGELYIGGLGLARGYLNRPELTAERFVELDIFGEQKRLYRTGDRVSWRADGNLLFLGRLDHQVKIRGYRIELGEIEGVLCATNGIKEAVVVAREDNPGDKRLVAYVVLDQSHVVTLSELRSLLCEQLPEYMIPAVFVPLSALPLSPNGKIDRKSLPVPELDRDALESCYTAPRNTLEHSLAELWQEVLMLSESPGIHDDFFALGGHSLLSATLVNRIQERFGLEVSLQNFFQQPTIAAVADALSKSLGYNEKPQEPLLDISQDIRKQDHPRRRRLLDSVVYRKLLSFIGSWRGERTGLDTLIVGRNTEGVRIPLFWVFQGEQELYQLARYIGEDQPVFGMRSGHLIMEYTEDNIQALALDYVHEIQTLKPSGPVVIGGNCQGAYIAMVIAQHLLRRGRHVPITILMEWSFLAQQHVGPVGLLFGRESKTANPYLRFDHPELMWQRVWPDHRVEIIPGGHGEFFNEPNVQVLADAVRRLIDCNLNSPLLTLPFDSLHAAISLINPPTRLLPGERYELRVRIYNESLLNWPNGADFGLTLVSHWFDDEGNIVKYKDGTIFLPEIAQGNAAMLRLPVSAPDHEGEFQLTVRLAEQGVVTPPKSWGEVYVTVCVR